MVKKMRECDRKVCRKIAVMNGFDKYAKRVFFFVEQIPISSAVGAPLEEAFSELLKIDKITAGDISQYYLRRLDKNSLQNGELPHICVSCYLNRPDDRN